MLDVILALMAVGVTAAAGPDADEPETVVIAPPVFLSPAAPAEKAVAPPAFLAPKVPQPVAEPQVPTGRFTTAIEVRPILEATRGAWVALREYDGQDLIYVTHLWSWRCGLTDLRIGLNGQPPTPWSLPDCHMDLPMPAAILEADGLPFRAFGAGTVQSVEVQITYDDLGTDTAVFERAAILIP